MICMLLIIDVFFLMYVVLVSMHIVLSIFCLIWRNVYHMWVQPRLLIDNKYFVVIKC